MPFVFACVCLIFAYRSWVLNSGCDYTERLSLVPVIFTDIIIWQLGTNDPLRLDPLVVGSSIHEGTSLLLDGFHVMVTLHRFSDLVINLRFHLLKRNNEPLC